MTKNDLTYDRNNVTINTTINDALYDKFLKRRVIK